MIKIRTDASIKMHNFNLHGIDTARRIELISSNGTTVSIPVTEPAQPTSYMMDTVKGESLMTAELTWNDDDKTVTINVIDKSNKYMLVVAQLPEGSTTDSEWIELPNDVDGSIDKIINGNMQSAMNALSHKQVG